MRTIKFRAWNKNIEGMSFGPDLIFTKGVVSSVRHQDWEGDSEPEAWTPAVDGYVEPEEVILEQFTGLLDKNGKEIYEGDILNVWDWGRPPNDLLGVVQVVWDETEKGWCFEPYMNIERYDMFRNSEVIGNIHENPELLKP